MHKPKIFITGGHLTPALATVDMLSQEKWQIWFIGRKYAQEDDVSVSIEYKTLINYTDKVKLLLITTGKIQRYFNLNSLLSLLKIPIGFIQSIYWFIKYKPQIVLSFGGYVAVPICIVAKLFSVPIVIQEQTRVMGLANKIIAKIADKICLSWPDLHLKYPQKTVVTGIPLRKAIFTINKKLELELNKPLLYVTGGSLGSHSINELFRPIISTLLEDFAIVYQCGNTKKYNDYAGLIKLQKELAPNLQRRFLALTYIDTDKLGWVYHHAFFVIGRSGANTVYELASLGIPAIFIPLPFAAGSEQMENAMLFQQHKAGFILQQKDLNSTLLYKKIIKLKKHINIYRSNAQILRNTVIVKGTENLIQVLTNVFNAYN